MNHHLDVGYRLINGVLCADAGKIADSFGPDVRLRALIPPGLVERHGAAEAAELIASWFADCAPLTLVESRAESVGDRLHLSYLLDVVEGRSTFIVQQQLYAEVIDELLVDVNLLCSGFRPK